MTVIELIRKLSKCDPHAVVAFEKSKSAKSSWDIVEVEERFGFAMIQSIKE